MKILFLCTGNSCRSQMAEGFARYHLSNSHQIYSAGTEAHGLNKRAVETMKGFGIDISHHESASLDKYNDVDFDLVITVCGDAHEKCPAYLKKAKVIHKGFPDPAKAEGSDEEIMKEFNNTAKDIEKYILTDLKKELAEKL